MSNMIQFPKGKAVLFNGSGKPFELIHHDVPTLNPGEILVKNLYTTLCGSDIHTYCGHRVEQDRVVLGHEIVGEVLCANLPVPLRDWKGHQVNIGDRIIWAIFAVSPEAASPRADMPQKSQPLFKYGHAPAVDSDIFNGGLSTYCILKPNTAFVKISDNMPLKTAATISCAHSTVMGALRISGVIAGKRILIFGAGLLGLSCAAMCREDGAEWIGLIDNDHTRLQWASRFGADETYAAPVDGIKEFPWPDADVVFDMSGQPQAMRSGINSLATGGTAVWIGAVFPAEAVAVDAQQLVRKILTIRGLHNYNYQDFILAADFIESNLDKYPFQTLIEKEFCLEDADQAFEYARRNKPVRVGINMDLT